MGYMVGFLGKQNSKTMKKNVCLDMETLELYGEIYAVGTENTMRTKKNGRVGEPNLKTKNIYWTVCVKCRLIYINGFYIDGGLGG